MRQSNISFSYNENQGIRLLISFLILLLGNTAWDPEIFNVVEVTQRFNTHMRFNFVTKQHEGR